MVGGGLTGRENNNNNFSSKRFEPNNSIADSHSHALSAMNLEMKPTGTNQLPKEHIKEAYEPARGTFKTKNMDNLRSRKNSTELSRAGSQTESNMRQEMSAKNRVTEKKISFIHQFLGQRQASDVN